MAMRNMISHCCARICVTVQEWLEENTDARVHLSTCPTCQEQQASGGAEDQPVDA